MLPVPFGGQVSFPQGQGSPEHAGCWAVCLGLGTSLGQSLRIPSPSLLEGKACWQHEATPGWEHQTPQPSSPGGEHREDKAPRGFPGRGALSGSSQPWDGISATSQEPKACAPKGQRMNPRSTGGTQTPTHITTAHHHTGSQGCSSDQLQTPTSLPAARSQDRQPTQLLTRELPSSSSSSQNQHAASRKEQRLLPPSHTALNTHSSALPPDTSSASLRSASPRSAPAVSCTLPLTPPAELLVAPPCPAGIPAPCSCPARTPRAQALL